MPRRRYIFDPPERFVAGTVGEPGRPDVLPPGPRGPPGRVSVVLEKVQVAVLAERLGELLDELERRGVRGGRRRTRRGAVRRHGPLDEPLIEAFRAGSLTLGWDGGAERVLVEARAQDEDGEADRPRRGRRRGRGRPGPAPRPAHAPAPRGRSSSAPSRVVAGGRPPCPLCGAPLDPRAHLPAAQRPLRQLGRPAPRARPRDDAGGPARGRDRGRRADRRVDQQRAVRAR